MNSKIIVGSIIAVAILIGVSFTSVVGYNTVKSTSGETSPLFNIRTNRAIYKENDDLTCDYVGKGEELDISISKRDNRFELSKKVFDNIKKMDDGTFNRYITTIITYLKKNRYSDIKSEDILTEMNELRAYIKSNNKALENIEEPQFYTENYNEYTFMNWRFGCIFNKHIILRILVVALFLILIIFFPAPTRFTECPIHCIKA